MNLRTKWLLVDLLNAASPTLRFFFGSYFDGRISRMASNLNRVKEVLASDTFLQSVCDSSAEVFELPFHHSKTEMGVIVWLHFRDEFVCHDNLVRAIQVSIRTPYEASLLRAYEGMDVVPYMGDNIAGEGRIVRVSFEKTAIEEVLNLCTSDFMGTRKPGYGGWAAEPADGVHVVWYRDPSGIPG